LAIGIRAVLRFVLLSGLGAPCLLIRFVLLLSDALVVLALHGNVARVLRGLHRFSSSCRYSLVLLT
jgi:hypothetical protein